MFGLNNSPLQYLAANGIAFIAGAAMALAFKLYGRHMHENGLKKARNLPQ